MGRVWSGEVETTRPKPLPQGKERLLFSTTGGQGPWGLTRPREGQLAVFPPRHVQGSVIAVTSCCSRSDRPCSRAWRGSGTDGHRPPGGRGAHATRRCNECVIHNLRSK